MSTPECAWPLQLASTIRAPGRAVIPDCYNTGPSRLGQSMVDQGVDQGAGNRPGHSLATAPLSGWIDPLKVRLLAVIDNGGLLRPRSCTRSARLGEILGMRLVHNTEDGFAVGAEHHEHIHSIDTNFPSTR